MKNIVINTQYMENYGDSLNPYMKFKGGSTYVVKTLNDAINDNEVATIVAQVRPLIQMTMADTNGGCEEYITDFKLLWIMFTNKPWQFLATSNLYDIKNVVTSGNSKLH